MNEHMNPHYDFNDPKNIACCKKKSDYDNAFIQAMKGDEKALAFLQEAEEEALGGQAGYAVDLKVKSPWGENTVISADIAKNMADEADVVKKEITVKPGFMLSLQRHRGRQELWEVKSGTLTVISDGKRIEVKAGESISLPKGNVHCMNNVHDEPVTVVETQTGICREADNVRLVDFNGRETIPLKTETEARSAILYAEMHAEIEQKFGCDVAPAVELSTPEYKQVVKEIKAV